MAIIRNLAGSRFGHLVAIELDPSYEKGRGWVCQCVCGTKKTFNERNLIYNGASSCGCKHGLIRHGHSRKGTASITHRSWGAMIQRCTNPGNVAFRHYNSLGVHVCERWKSFDNFLADMGERPSLQHSLDRYPNKTGNYEPWNCRWATKREQANNRITNRLVTFQGQEMTMAELARKTGLPKELLRHRITRAGWPVEDAVSEPKQQGRRDVRRRLA